MPAAVRTAEHAAPPREVVEPPALVVSGVRRAFGSLQALDGVDLSLATGEWTALLGPNGAGKTTLMRIVAGLIREDAGIVSAFGRGRPGARDLGFVPQRIALHDSLTAREHLELHCDLVGVARADRADRVAWALDFSQLGERADDLVGRYSGGMQRRLNLAVSVLHRPRLLLLDEPTEGVDPQARAAIWRMIGELRASGTTILHATHLIEEAESLVDSVVIIDHGRVVARGEAATLASDLGIPRYELQARPRAEVEADFAPPIGTWDGRSVRVPLAGLGDTLVAAVAALESIPGGVEGVRLREASLEEAFLRLTGRELRE
jgi:ABC-2 type transport system ATP-binding protein